ncbi:MAG: 4-hydroxybutyrate CoA-transferase [Dehalococcoidia bacterium]|nr:4-hydroxybutyrate CoA-transferase [Chloroflexi bacterium CFX7]NUQ56581.1 4-hydroxybutyrate CoA-transferase [Dehalococcoidia bacterium]RIL02241.1 MAG: 4-hydroxybutyrate CoA-transferase [bacterium]
MDWKVRYGKYLMSPEDAAGLVKSGDRIWLGMFTSCPNTFSNALLARKDEVRAVEVHHYVSPFVWSRPDTQEAFHLVTCFTTPADRAQIAAGMGDYLPIGNFRQSWIQAAIGPFDVVCIKTSPPDENGYLSMGTALWANRTALDVGKTIICEVDDRLIRTFGENYIHMSEVTALVEHNAGHDQEMPVPPRTDEVILATEVVGTLIATELIHDRDTLQIGFGDVTAALGVYLGDCHDLGIQTEIIPGGIVDLVDQGVVTGRYKDVAPGKVVGSAFGVIPDEEARRVHMNPKFELWDFCHTDDLRMLVRETNFVAINNALQVDLTGQVTAETLNGRIYSGPGGQTTFAVAASYSEGGRSVIALPSVSTVNGVPHSRIVPTLSAGTVITVPRSFVDYVVTEHGIAHVGGKSVRQRCEELISVAHPDFRAELRREAEKLYCL